MFQKLLTALFLIISLSIFSLAQTAPNSDKTDNDQNKQLKSAKQKKKNIANQTFGVGVMDLTNFLPESENAWTLTLTSSGGFAGITRLLAAVNSNGNYLCNPNQEFRNRLLEEDVLNPIFDFVETFDFSNFYKNEVLTIKGCMDCSYPTLTLQTKNGFVSRTSYTFSNDAVEIRRIYDRLASLEECR